MKSWPYPEVIAHRGGGSLAPENTLAGIDTAARYGHQMIECDVKLSRDHQPFLLHDDSLDRTTNGTGNADEHDWQQIRQLDAGKWHSGAFAGEPPPLLSQVAARCQQHRMMINIEIKPSPGRERETGQLIAQAARALWQGHTPPPLLSSFSVDALHAARQAAPQLPRALLLHHWRADWRTLAESLGCFSVHLNHILLTPLYIEAIKSAGLFLMAYTVNKPARARHLLEQGVNSICTDRLDLIGGHAPLGKA